MKVDEPVVERAPNTAAFLDGLEQRQVLLPRCSACQRFAHPGARRCDVCLSYELESTPVSGAATLFSYVVIEKSLHPAFDAPYSVCVFELDEGPRLVGHLVGANPSVGLRVKVDFAASGKNGVPLRFAPYPDSD
jgi:uncharacterized OB-fold protein